MDSGCSVKAGLMGFAEESDVGYKGKRGDKHVVKSFALRGRKDGVAIN